MPCRDQRTHRLLSHSLVRQDQEYIVLSLRALLALLALSSTLSAQAGIYKCQDLRSGSTLFSSEPCDPHSQRLVTILQAEELEKRQSTFDGAALKQKEQARQRRAE